MTRLCFIDCETTSLRHDRRAWEVGLIVRDPGEEDQEHSWLIHCADLELGNADLRALQIGRFHERHPQATSMCIYAADDSQVTNEPDAMAEIETLTRGAHLVGAVVSFDADVLSQRMRAQGICPSWHYHLIDVEALAIGFLHGRRDRQNEIVDGYPAENDGREAPGLVRWNEPPRQASLPWKSDDLSAALGVTVSEDERHTALGDARWARAIYDAVVPR